MLKNKHYSLCRKKKMKNKIREQKRKIKRKKKKEKRKRKKEKKQEILHGIYISKYTCGASTKMVRATPQEKSFFDPDPGTSKYLW